MKKPILLIVLIFGCYFTSIGQVQLTEIYNPSPFLKYDNHGFVNIEGVEYLIESNSESTRVSKIDETIEVLYELNYPPGVNISQYHGNYNTRSGYVIDDIYLYEIYTDPIFSDEIHKRNLLNGEIVETYKYLGANLNLVRNFEVVDHIFHFEMSFGDDFIFYDTETEELTKLPFEKENTYRHLQTYYTVSFVQKGITTYNALDKSSTISYEDITVSYVSANNNIDGRKGLIVGGFEGTHRFINEDTTFLLSCYHSYALTVKGVFDSEDHYLFFKVEGDDLYIDIIDKSDCSLIEQHYVEKSISEHIFKVFDSPAFEEEYFLFSFNYASYSDNELILFDRKASTFDTIDTHNDLILFIDDQSFYRSGDEIFFIGQDAGEPDPDHNLYSIQLETKELDIQDYKSEYGKSLAFGTSQNDASYFLAYKHPNLNVFDFVNNSQNEIKDSIHDAINSGMYITRYLASEFDKIAFQFRNKVYFSDFIFGTSMVFEGYKASSMKIDNYNLEGLICKNDTTYHFEYNKQSTILQKTQLEHNLDLAYSFTVENYIFGEFSKTDKFYFDLESKTLKEIPIEGEIISCHQSKDHVLILTQCESEFCLTSFIDGKFSEFEFPFQNQPEIFPKENGDFLILENKAFKENVVYAIDENGTYNSKITVLATKLTRNQENIAKGELGAMMFYDNITEMVTVVLQGNSKFHKYEIPYSNASSHNIIWYKAGKSLILKSEDVTSPGIYACTLGKDLNKLILNDIGFPNYRLLLALNKDKILSIIVDSQLFGFEIAVYDEEAQTVNFVKELNFDEDIEFNYDPYSLHSKYQLTDDNYLVTFTNVVWWDQYQNTEPFLFNVNDAQMYYYGDINNRIQTSNPNSFYSNSDYLFFLARSPGDNSYQLFLEPGNFTTSIKNDIEKDHIFNIYPNPSKEYVSLNTNADVIKIYNYQGHFITSYTQYKAKESLEIANLPRGVYFLEIINGSQRSMGKLLKI